MSVLPIVAACLATSALAAGVANLANGIINDVFNEKEWRETYTQNFIDKMRAQYPNYNVVMIHTPHSVHGNYVHQHVEEDMPIGSIGYEVYFSIISEPFDLTNEGDGGFENWCFIGYNRDGNLIWANEPEPAEPNPNPGNGGGGHGGHQD